MYKRQGLRGLEILEDLLPDMPKDVPVVLDAKRGDMGETQKYYAHAYFERLGVDAVTLSPFMGYDTLDMADMLYKQAQAPATKENRQEYGLSLIHI